MVHKCIHKPLHRITEIEVVWKSLIMTFPRCIYLKIYNLVFVSIRIQHVYLEHQKKSDYKKGMSQKEKKKQWQE